MLASKLLLAECQGALTPSSRARAVVGGGFDRVSCGPGSDTVYADVTDEVATDCEVVNR